MGDSISVSKDESERIPTETPALQGNGETVQYFLGGSSFTQLVKNNTPYGALFQTLTLYEVLINRQGPHWYLLVRLEGSSLPFITFEIITTNGRTCKAMICVIQANNVEGETACVSQTTTLEKICSTADMVMSQMGRYDPLNYNGQQFCNALLRSFGADVFQTSIGPRLPNNGLEDDPIINESITGYNTDFDNSETVTNSVQERVKN